ncbi:hypothetical protein ACFL4G_12060, partial [Thermodesulfobacteriota bacterium]
MTIHSVGGRQAGQVHCCTGEPGANPAEGEREGAAGGREFGQGLAGKLDYGYFDKELLPMISQKVGAAPGKIEAFEQDKWGIQNAVIDLLKTRYPKLDAKGIDEGEYMLALK